MQKKYIVPGMLVVGTLVLSGCNGQSEDTISQNDVVVPTIAEEEYVIADEDFVKGNGLVADIEKSDVNEAEKADLLLMREEEKLARDVYLTLSEKWGQKIFTNIAGSEQTHTDAIKVMLDRYEIADPVTDDTIGVFTNPDLQKLYNDLVAQGNASLVAALTVGATIEDLDIKDLQDAIARTDNEDIIAVYEKLTSGSRNHMRAFHRQLERNGATYEAQFLTQGEIDVILAGEQERGSGDGQGGNGHKGNGGGRGQR